MQNQNAISSCISRVGTGNPPPVGTRLVLVGTVDMAAEPVDTGNNARVASHPSGYVLPDDATVRLAQSKLRRAVAHNLTFCGAAA
jgi:hypothetical protein